MARYREKTPDELAWNDIRRRITRQFDSELAAYRERALNELLTHAFEEFVRSLETGEELQIRARVADWVAEELTRIMTPRIAEIKAHVSDIPPA